MGVHTPGRPSALHPRLKMTYKRMIKIERIARLTLDPSGFNNDQIANHLGIHRQTVVYIRQLPAFHAKIAELQSGVLSHYDADLRSNIDNARQELRDMIPLALNVIRDAAMGKKGHALQFKAATEIMNREGNLAPVSKSEVKVERVPVLEADPTVVSSLLDLLNSAPATKQIDFTVSAQASNQPTHNKSVEELLDSVDSKVTVQ